jgi:butyrate kinase
MEPHVLVINPGSTSTKIAVFKGDTRLFDSAIEHSAMEIGKFPTIASQFEFREKAVRGVLEQKNFDLGLLEAVVGRGGLLHPIEGGVYRVNADMIADMKAARYGEHASNLGVLLADKIARGLGIPAYIADPVVVDELSDIARISGHALFRRKSIFHALNQKAVARRFANEHGRRYDDLTLIVAHMGGGVSVGLHQGGKVVDVNQALNGEGPFSPERAGTLPTGDLVKLCFSGKFSESEVLRMLTGAGGLVSFIGSNDMREAEKLFKNRDNERGIFFLAFVYQVGKAIGALAAAASGKVDGILLTGGVAYSGEIIKRLSEMVSFIAPVAVYPGEGELEALARAGVSAISGTAQIVEYRGEVRT